jgi:hypothetical protein
MTVHSHGKMRRGDRRIEEAHRDQGVPVVDLAEEARMAFARD